MLRFEADRDFTQPPGDVWAKLTDARFLVSCLPDVEAVRELQPDRAALTLRPGFAFVRGSLDVVLQIVDLVAPRSARVVLQSKGIGSSADVEATLALAAQEGGAPGTRVHWTAEVKALGGLLKLVPSGLIRGAAQKVIGDVWNAVEAKLAAQTGGG